MLTPDNISNILSVIRSDHPDATEADIAFCILSDAISDRATAYRLAYNKKTLPKTINEQKFSAIANSLRPFGIGSPDEAAVSREENRDALIALLKKLQDPDTVAKIGVKDALNLEKDIRVKLQDKFDMGDNDNATRRIIIVPQKHDYICPHTNRECSKMPSKEACIKFYDLQPRQQ